MVDSSEYFVVRRGATAVRNKTLRDASLSIQAIGLLMLMLATPPGAPMGYRAYAGRGMGEKALRSAIRELEVGGYRFRYRTRRAGVLRTATIVFDEPVSEPEARATVTEMSAHPVETCVSHDVEIHRAAPVAARCEPQDSNDATVPCSTVARSTEARSTEARSGAAQLLLRSNSKDSSLRSKSLPSNPREEPVDNSAEASRMDGGTSRPSIRSVGSPPTAASPDTSGDAAARPSSADHGLVDECLPEPMRYLPGAGTTAVARRLRVLIDAGWRPGELRQALASKALPPEVRSMAHLVLYRLNDIDPEAAPAARTARRHSDEQLLEACIPPSLTPLLGPGRTELADYIRSYIDSGRLTTDEVRAALGDYPACDNGHPSVRAILTTLKKLGLLDAAASRSARGTSP